MWPDNFAFPLLELNHEPTEAVVRHDDRLISSPRAAAITRVCWLGLLLGTGVVSGVESRFSLSMPGDPGIRLRQIGAVCDRGGLFHVEFGGGYEAGCGWLFTFGPVRSAT
jgi:hypothetical protein